MRTGGLIALVSALALSAFLAATAFAVGAFDFAQLPTSPEPAGDGPRAVVIANLDGDADQDLAVADGNVGAVTILKNAGAGDLSVSGTESAGAGPSSIAAADFDGDTDVDLAVTSADNNFDNVTILRNNGSGGFTNFPGSPESAELAPSAIVAADLDGDSDPDLAVANTQSQNVTILRNNGLGNFVEPASSPEATGQFPNSIVAANFDGDADQDLAVANGGPDNLTILRNNGAGNFTEPGTSPEAVGEDPISLTAGDFDGDADPDLAVVNLGADVTILKRAANSNFVEPASSPEAAGPGPFAIASADINGDSKLDLAVANNAANSLVILRNAGTANFAQPASSPEPANLTPSAVAFADLDGDADQDLVAANTNSDDVTVLRNR
jgi:FG-GAP-like repeat